MALESFIMPSINSAKNAGLSALKAGINYSGVFARDVYQALFHLGKLVFISTLSLSEFSILHDRILHEKSLLSIFSEERGRRRCFIFVRISEAPITRDFQRSSHLEWLEVIQRRAFVFTRVIRA